MSTAAKGRTRRHEVTFDELSELRYCRQNCAARAACDVFVVRWNVWINDRLRGTFWTGKFFGHGILQ